MSKQYKKLTVPGRGEVMIRTGKSNILFIYLMETHSGQVEGDLASSEIAHIRMF